MAVERSYRCAVVAEGGVPPLLQLLSSKRALALQEAAALTVKTLAWEEEVNKRALRKGGAVARHSRHLAQYGGIAVDLVAVVARSRERVSQSELGEICRRHFDFVKDDYGDGHVHADNRSRAQ